MVIENTKLVIKETSQKKYTRRMIALTFFILGFYTMLYPAKTLALAKDFEHKQHRGDIFAAFPKRKKGYFERILSFLRENSSQILLGSSSLLLGIFAAYTYKQKIQLFTLAKNCVINSKKLQNAYDNVYDLSKRTMSSLTDCQSAYTDYVKKDELLTNKMNEFYDLLNSINWRSIRKSNPSRPLEDLLKLLGIAKEFKDKE